MARKKRKITAEDCISCGACCGGIDSAAHDPSVWVGPITVDDYLALRPKERLALSKFTDDSAKAGVEEGYYLPMHPEEDGHRCDFLSGRVGEAVSCLVYERRPGICRVFEPNAPMCLEMRIHRGVDPIPPSALLVRTRRE